MKRALRIFAAAALFVVVLFALLVALLPRETLRTRIGEQIAAWTGRDVSLSGQPELDLFPRLTVTLNDVKVAGPAGMENAEVVSMDRLTGTIRLLPLIIGRVEIGSFKMVRPTIRLVRDAAGARNWAFDSGAAALQLAFSGDVPLGEFLLEDAVILFEDRGSGKSERIDSVDLSIGWTSVRQPLSVAGTGIWRGESVRLSASAATPFDFINGGSTPVEARLESAPVTMSFEGDADDYPSSRLVGPISLSSPSLRRLANWIGNPVGSGSTLGPASLSGAATFSSGILSVENADLALDGNDATGALKVAVAGKPEIAGTLAFDRLDLTAYFAGLANAFRTVADWRGIALDTDWFRDLTADLRVSAASVQIGALKAGASAAAMSLRGGRLEVGLARAEVNGGNVAGDLAIVDAAEGQSADVEAQIRVTDVDLGSVAPLLSMPAELAGTASATIDAAAKGSSLGALVTALAGSARIDVQNGAVPLFGVADLGAADAASAVPATSLAVTPVASLSTVMSFASGSGVVERANVVAPAFTVDAVGRIGFLDGSLGLEGTLYPGGSGGEAAGEPRAFRIGGTLRQPVAVPLALAN